MTDIQNNLKKTVNFLSKEVGPRGYLQIEALNKTADYIRSEFGNYGYTVLEQPYEVEGHTYKNIFVEIRGEKPPEKVLIVGAHYDTVMGTPGADDNASGIAGLLELARLLSGRAFDKTIQLVAFTLEEPPFFRSGLMGSHVYAKSLRQKGIDVEGMICLEMIGYFTDAPESQLFPMPFFRWMYPAKGNFIIIISNIQSKSFLKRVKSAFKKGTDLPVESLSAFPLIPGIDFSDHRSFWKFKYDAVMVTDTAFYRNPQYHGLGDIPERLDYERMAKVVLGLKSSIEELAISNFYKKK
ncbi:MAG: M28 family peptidase [Nitrospirae bacterium]|nr:M28 family peptidase [Nitrospirota bacterium]